MSMPLGSAPVLVTGSAGFIGSNFVRLWLRNREDPVISVDKLTYAGNLASLFEALDHPRHSFVHADIGDYDTIIAILMRRRPWAIVNFAAESHVDYSIETPEPFIETNVGGTFRLLEAALNYWRTLDAPGQEDFRFLHVSTDEVFGSLEPDEPRFDETTPYRPSSPYSASKAASDHLVHAWGHTYGLPVLTTNCTNNYGPAQFPEKLIPLMLFNALRGNPLTIHGDGLYVRDWIHVEDHCRAVMAVLECGRTQQQYCIGAQQEVANIDLVERLCTILDSIRPRENGRSYHDQITFVSDRLGQDRRYAVDPGKVMAETWWEPEVEFNQGLWDTVEWYLGNNAWIETVMAGQNGEEVA